MAGLARGIDGKIEYLERDLDGGGAVLRRGVESFVRGMAGGKKDELGASGVVFRSLADPSKIEVSLESGEASREEARGKIERIVQGCITAARADLAFLRSVKKALDTGAQIPQADLAKARNILDNNTYWRLIEAT